VVLQTTVFLTTMDHYAKVNEVYLKYFTKNPPARSCFAVAALPRSGLVEIEAIALVSGSKL
jgi:2-iminobutanoate/2-iminopropanoate deaminase